MDIVIQLLLFGAVALTVATAIYWLKGDLDDAPGLIKVWSGCLIYMVVIAVGLLLLFLLVRFVKFVWEQ